MSRLEDWIRCDGLLPDRKVCAASVDAGAPLEGWRKTVDEALHICPAHLDSSPPPQVRTNDLVLLQRGDGTLEGSTIAKRVSQGRVLLDGGRLEIATHRVVVLAPHAGG